ncbi:MAG: nitroreductase [Marmoricola sp.]|nr:nitroreductase [Marmoricola sp.]
MAVPTEQFEAFDKLVRARRATRHFRPDLVPADLLERIVDTARWAPSGYNLQPTHFVVVTDPAVRESLYAACLNQNPVREAPALIVITGDRNVARNHLEQTLEQERVAGAIKPAYESLLRRVVPLAFHRGPLGLGWLWKATLLPIVRIFRPIPELPAVHLRFWLAKQTALCGMNVMLATEAAGLASLPMEGFDERRVRRVLHIPGTHVVALIIAIGIPSDAPGTKSRLPLAQVLHHNRW